MPCPTGNATKQIKRLSDVPSVPESTTSSNGKGGGNSTKEKFNWQWYDPPEDGLFASFCDDTSLHGIQYLGQQGRHMFERLI